MTPLRWLRRLAALSVLFLVCVVAYQGLRSAGLRFRWESGPAAGTPEARLPPRLDRQSSDRRPEAGRAVGEATGGPDAPSGRVAESPSDAGAWRGTAPPGTFPRPAGARLIDFERLRDASPGCPPCPLSDQYASRGVIFSFRSWSASSPLPFLVDAGEYLREGDPSPLRVGPALADAARMEVGVIRMDLPGRPTVVTFEVVGPSLIPQFEITAWSDGRRIESGEIPRFEARTFRADGGGSFRSEWVAVEAPSGIDRIELDGWGPPGHLLLIDHLVIAGGRDSGS